MLPLLCAILDARAVLPAVLCLCLGADITLAYRRMEDTKNDLDWINVNVSRS